MINRMRTFSTRMENDFSVLRHELDFRAGLKTEAIADRQRDGDLTLGETLRKSVAADRTTEGSPVYSNLPKLVPPDASQIGTARFKHYQAQSEEWNQRVTIAGNGCYRLVRARPRGRERSVGRQSAGARRREAPSLPGRSRVTETLRRPGARAPRERSVSL